ncbi:helix-turn-helix domain-containing protein [Algoriphagus persicinus]|uniref:helix-turn-helix domain-containing protein n=1 Tax=Algoriphagus persicinus TaxID=3108754 RepID=UPI002B3A8991|nr:helix-turn-helix domain-containing protein [Algoriphagus sp. E1-3-M2]MEB2786206.1 helix-turn-helix domain-containing protein [Algoriphagus sp. E1-3-M2]|tara:strand:+ start:2853 stop:3134 length:282 start_codon:yes stop_codon:yes gene_type:complete
MNNLILSPIDKGQLINEIAEAIVFKLNNISKPSTAEEEFIKIPEVMKLLGRSRNTINSWRKEGFLKEHIINSSVYFKKSEVLDAGRQRNPRKK